MDIVASEGMKLHTISKFETWSPLAQKKNEPGFESPFAAASKIRHFRSFHDALVHAAV